VHENQDMDEGVRAKVI